MKQPKKILYYGKDEPLAKQIEIKAGPLSLFYEAGDLRYIKFNEKAQSKYGQKFFNSS